MPNFHQTILIVFVGAVFLLFCGEQTFAQQQEIESSSPDQAKTVERTARIPRIPAFHTDAPKNQATDNDSPTFQQNSGSNSTDLPPVPSQFVDDAAFGKNPTDSANKPDRPINETIAEIIGDVSEPNSANEKNKPKRKTKLASDKKQSMPNPSLADQPLFGERFHHGQPLIDESAVRLPYEAGDFSDNHAFEECPPNPVAEIDVYEGKYSFKAQQPLLNIGRPYYGNGQFAPGSSIFGKANLLTPRFIAYGDWRTAAASNIVNGDHRTQIATRLNLDLDLKLTATERIHAFVRPFDRGAEFTRLEIDSGNYQFFDEFDFEFETGFFEGDLGSIVGGMFGEVMPFDLPFSIGQIPLFLQNGLWLEDGFIGAAATIPARNSRLLDISNIDTTFFFGFDNITSPVFQGDDDAAKMYGVASFIDAMDGYFELDYAFLEDRRVLNRSYHNVGLSFSRRYGRISNSLRLFINGGQDPNGIARNAEGLLLLIENSFVSRRPYTVVPYLNMFAGFGHPQSVARAGGTGGILKNTGINFESDGLTNYPTLDDSGAEAFGGAVGINMIADDLAHQLILEFAFLQTMGIDPARLAVDDQYGIGTRYQKPLTNSVILRADAMYGFFVGDQDVMGARLELRKKF